MVAVISVDVYPFLSFSDLIYHSEDKGQVFSGCTVSPDSKETKLESSDQETSPSADKNAGVVLVPCLAQKCVPAAISGGVGIPKVPGSRLHDR